jgi:UDP-glucose 4-epimerase
MIDRILITGGKGFIGGHLVEDFYNRKMCDAGDVSVIDKAEAGVVVDRGDFADYARFDMSERPEELHKFLVHFDPDVIVHLAAWSNVREAQNAPEALYRHNVMATANLIRGMSNLAKDQRNLAHVVFASSSAAENPVSHYGVTKLTGEHMLNVFSAETGIPVTCLRFGNVYGPRQNPANGTLIATALEKALAGCPLEIFGKGQQTRDYVYVKDLVAFIAKMICDRIEGVHNVSTGTSFTTFTVVDTFMYAYESCTGSPAPEPLYGPARPADKQHVRMPPSEAVTIDFMPLIEGMQKQIKWRLKGNWRMQDNVNWSKPVNPVGDVVSHEMATTLVESLEEWLEMYYHKLADAELAGKEPPF